MAIHPTAIIGKTAKIGKNPEVGPYAVIEDNVTIGDDCFIDAHVKIAKYTTIGDRCRFYLGALVGEEPQDHRMDPSVVSYCEIGNDTILREYVTVHRSPFPDAVTRIGNHTLLMGFVHVGHDCQIGNYVTAANHTAISGHVIVEDGAVLSGYILIHQFCRIGRLVMMSPGTKIRQDIPPFCMLSDNVFICGVNVIGMRRANFDSQTRLAIKKAVKTFFFKGLSAHNALEEIEKNNATPETMMFVKFIRESQRGIVGPDPDMLRVGSRHSDENEEEEDK